MIELVLVHHRVRARIRARAGKEVEDVAEAGHAVVEEVLAVTRAIETAADLDPRLKAPTP